MSIIANARFLVQDCPIYRIHVNKLEARLLMQCRDDDVTVKTLALNSLLLSHMLGKISVSRIIVRLSLGGHVLGKQSRRALHLFDFCILFS